MKILLCSLIVAATAWATPTVEYRLRFPNAVHHEAEIRAAFKGVTGPVLEVVMSRSSPGRYALHEFAKNVYNVRASDGEGHPLTVTRPNPYGWNIAAPRGTVIVDYTLYGDHADGTYAAIDETHAHLNLPATLMWAHGFERAASTITFEAPSNSNWRAATQLIPHADGSFSAPNLEWLMDSPVELSAHTMNEWKVEDATFRLALHHRGSQAEANSYAELCKAVVLEEEGVFGAFPRYENGTYTFLLDYLPYVSGDGMEHRDSTVITVPGELSTSAHFAIEAVSHEFFHSWNVKRIRPRSLEPFDFERADMSDELWFAEGFTNYYGQLVTKRAGISTLDEFLQSMGGAVNTVLNAPGRRTSSAVDMSRWAPFVDAAKAIDATNSTNTFISYYTYGQALALGLDLAIRQHYPGKSLDDWMRAMWRQHPDIGRPYTLLELQQTLGQTVRDQSFAEEFFAHHITGVAPLDYAGLLAAAGLKLRSAHPGKPWAGGQHLDSSGDGVEIASNTQRDSPFYNAGLDRGDRILECDRRAIKNTEDWTAALAKHAPGDRLNLKVNTRSGEKMVELNLAEDPTLELVTYEKAGLKLAEEMKSLREGWLSSKALHRLPSF